MARLTLHVNGKSSTLDVAPDTPLLWVLRDLLDLKGTKYSCGIGECGSCTVLIDGEATRSCQITVGEATGEITTIEGLGKNGLHPVQQAWIDEQVPQCGYCQSGQILTAVELLENTPRPTAKQIEDAMSGVLCRCGSYQRIRKAIARAAEGGDHE